MTLKMNFMEEKKERTIIHVELFEPKDGRTHFYFGCLLAVFDFFTAEEVGVTRSKIQKTAMPPVYETSKCIIRKSKLISKKNKR